MFVKAIVGYLDIMGYQNLVRRAISNKELVKRLESLFYKASVGSLKKLSEIDLTGIAQETDKEGWQYYQEVVKAIHVRNNADSFIFTLPLSKVNYRGLSFDKKGTLLNCIETYFSVMTMFATLFTSKMGHLLRGGISIGNHYENERENQLFVFSEAHNRAVTLESRKSKNPRILLDDALLLYLKETSYPHVAKFFYRDEDGFYCLDIYSALGVWGERKGDVLSDIVNGITLNMQSNIDNKEELGKLLYFAKYHNRWICREEINLPHMSFDIRKYEERLKQLNSSSRL
jgi:hypothetical protein